MLTIAELEQEVEGFIAKVEEVPAEVAAALRGVVAQKKDQDAIAAAIALLQSKGYGVTAPPQAAHP